MIILIYKILNFAHGDWRVRCVYFLIDSYEIIRFTFTIFKRVQLIILKLFSAPCFDWGEFWQYSENKNLLHYIVNLDKATYTGRLKYTVVAVIGEFYFVGRYSLYLIWQLINYKIINAHHFGCGEYCCDYNKVSIFLNLIL